MLFHKNVDLINKFQSLENKIDVIMNEFKVLSFNQENIRCCDCEKREADIFRDLTAYIESKFNSFENDIVEKLDILTNLEQTKPSQVTQEDVKQLIDNHRNSLTEELKNICTVSDKNLRQDLNSFILGIKYDIISEIKKYYEIQSTRSQELNNIQTNQIVSISDKQNIIENKIDTFCYDNEMIKHQLLLEEEIRKYYDEITSLKSHINTSISEVDKIISEFKSTI